MSRRSTGDILAAALEISLSRHLGDMREVRHSWTNWHSATFVGARHEIRFSMLSAGAAKLATLADDDLPLSRGFVADVVVIAQASVGDEVIVDLEVLTIAD